MHDWKTPSDGERKFDSGCQAMASCDTGIWRLAYAVIHSVFNTTLAAAARRADS